LRSQLEYYQIDVIHHESFHNMFIIFELCRGLIEINKSQHNHFITRLILLILTLHVFTVIKERIFLAMKHVKNVFHNKMKEEFLLYFMMIYIERELTEDIYSDLIIYEFYFIKY
jgi:hypothetical protein